MKINNDNYIEYFVNYYDQNLSQQEMAELFSFLEHNPGLEKEFYNFLSVPPLSDYDDLPISVNKTTLLKSEEENFNIQCIDYIENQMNDDEKQHFLFTLNADRNKQVTFNYFLATIQQADKNISFPKHLIKPYQHTKVRHYILAAATVVILMSLTFVIQFYSKDTRTIQTNTFTTLNKVNHIQPITVKKVLRPKILSQENIEKTKEEINQHDLKQTKRKNHPFNTIETIQKNSANPLIESNLAFVSPLNTHLIDIPEQNNSISEVKVQKTSNNKSLKDFAIEKVNKISKGYIEITQGKKNPNKIDKIAISTKKFSIKKY